MEMTAMSKTYTGLYDTLNAYLVVKNSLVRKQRCEFVSLRELNGFIDARRDLCLKMRCFRSSLVYEEEEDGLSVRDVENQFSCNSPDEEQLSLVSSVMNQNLPVEVERTSASNNLGKILDFPNVKLHFLEEQDEGILSKRILSLSRSNKIRSALELFVSMHVSGLQPSAHACNSLVTGLLRSGALDDALKVFDVLHDRDMATCHTYSLVLKAVSNFEGCDSALEMFNAFKDDGLVKKKFDIIVYNTMLSIYARARNWVETERLWRNLGDSGLVATMITYDLLISTFVQCGQAELAADAYCEMVRNQMEPSEDILKAMLASFTKDGKWELGLKVFQKMLDKGIKPNMIACNSMTQCLAKAGKDDLAFKVFDILKSLGHVPDEYTWSALLSALYQSDRYADSIQLFEGIKEDYGLELNSHLYNTALMSCRRLGLWKHSLQILWQMENTGVQMSTVSYNHAISACEVAREPKAALQIYQHMLERQCAPDTFTYLSLIRSFIWGSLWSEIVEILECVGPDCSIYNALIQGLCLRGKTALAKELYAKMRSIGLKPDGKTRALMLQHLPADRRTKRN